jgi:hypothetical protein
MENQVQLVQTVKIDLVQQVLRVAQVTTDQKVYPDELVPLADQVHQGLQVQPESFLMASSLSIQVCLKSVLLVQKKVAHRDQKVVQVFQVKKDMADTPVNQVKSVNRVRLVQLAKLALMVNKVSTVKQAFQVKLVNLAKKVNLVHEVYKVNSVWLEL